MEAKLVVVGGKQAGKEIPIPGAKFLIGRGEDCQLRPQSDLVSRQHCAILVEAGTVTVRDLNSRNGTLVNGERIKGDRELKTGDRLKIGPLEFDVQLSVPVAGKKKPKVRNIQEAAARTVESAVGGTEDLDISSWLEDQEETEASFGARSTDTLPFSTASTSVTAPMPAGTLFSGCALGSTEASTGSEKTSLISSSSVGSKSSNTHW